MPKLTSIFMFGNYELTNIKICKIMGKSGTNVKSEFEYVFCASRDWWGKLCHRSLSSLSCDKCCNVACCRRGFCVTQPLKFRYIRRRHLLLCVTQWMLMMMAVAVTLAPVSPAIFYCIVIFLVDVSFRFNFVFCRRIDMAMWVTISKIHFIFFRIYSFVFSQA